MDFEQFPSILWNSGRNPWNLHRKSAELSENLQKFAKIWRVLKIGAKDCKIPQVQLQNLVQFEKRCKMRLLSLSELSIQPRTSLRKSENPPKNFLFKTPQAPPPPRGPPAVKCDYISPRRHIPHLLLMTYLGDLYTESGHTLDGSFSSVSRPPIARVGAFFTVFRDLQDCHSFAPLRIQNFSKNLPIFSIILQIFCKILLNFY